MTVKIAAIQVNLTVGDLAGNYHKIQERIQRASQLADILILPELSLSSYMPEDLLYRPHFIHQQTEYLQQLQQHLAAYPQKIVLVGHVAMVDGELYNAASVFQGERCLGTYYKQERPNYSVFDEKRYFQAGQQLCSFTYQGQTFGVAICEDIWWDRVGAAYQQAGVDTLLTLNASPYRAHKRALRHEVIAPHCKGMNLVYCNLVGGQDEVVFDGASFALNPDGQYVAQAPMAQEGDLIVDFAGESRFVPVATPVPPMLNDDTLESEIWQSLVLATRDYVHKTGFQNIVLGLSGGIDSAVVLAIAVDALGAQHCRAIMMPSQYTADISVTDAAQMAQQLGVQYDQIAIAPMMQSFEASLATLFAGLPPDTTEENIQARIRGTLLMAVSNKTGALVLTTGNKSELATGYCTLYGDMVGAYAVIKDVYKTMVYRLARWRNEKALQAHQVPPIPERIITRAPSAELRANQTDQDSLPDYAVLDAILTLLIEEKSSTQAIIAETGYDAQVVQKVARLLKMNEYKRRQAPLGPKVSSMAFGKDWRYPLTNGFQY